MEEYDNLEGDRPSCFQGVKRRLFQSVVGHPLLRVLTLEDIKQELRDCVRQHFSQVINDNNRTVLRDAWNMYIVTAELSDAEPLRVLNITTAQQEAFCHHMTEKYGEQFTDERLFRRYIETEFALKENDARPSDCMHALKFDGLIQLNQLLNPQTATISSVGLFSQPQPNQRVTQRKCCAVM